MAKRTITFLGPMAVVLCLAACSPASGPAVDIDSARERAQVVRICPDGTYIGIDPVTRRLLYVSSGMLVGSQGFIARGVAVDQVCPARAS